MNRAISWLFKTDWEFIPAYNVFWLSTRLLLLQLLLHPTTIPSKFLPNFMCSLYFFNPCISLCVATVLTFNLIRWNLGISLGATSLNKAYSPLPGGSFTFKSASAKGGTLSAHFLRPFWNFCLACSCAHSHSFSKILWAIALLCPETLFWCSSPVSLVLKVSLSPLFWNISES